MAYEVVNSVIPRTPFVTTISHFNLGRPVHQVIPQLVLPDCVVFNYFTNTKTNTEIHLADPIRLVDFIIHVSFIISTTISWEDAFRVLFGGSRKTYRFR